jgi:hypothetical protein
MPKLNARPTPMVLALISALLIPQPANAGNKVALLCVKTDEPNLKEGVLIDLGRKTMIAFKKELTIGFRPVELYFEGDGGMNGTIDRITGKLWVYAGDSPVSQYDCEKVEMLF